MGGQPSKVTEQHLQEQEPVFLTGDETYTKAMLCMNYPSPNMLQAYYLLKKAARAGSAAAYYELGKMYLSHSTSYYFRSQAEICFRKGAVLGSAACKFEGAILEMKGSSPPKQAKCLDILEEAANEQWVPAMIEMGLCYLNEIGHEKDLDKACEWFTRAALIADPATVLFIGTLFDSSAFMNEKSERFVNFYEQLCENSTGETLYELGRYMRISNLGFEENETLALLTIAGEKGCGRAFQRLGRLYATGVHLPADNQKMLECFQKGDELGHSPCTRELAGLYYFGKGVDRDVYKAHQLYQKACDMGDVKACYWLGTMYQTFESVMPDGTTMGNYNIEKVNKLFDIVYNCGTEKIIADAALSYNEFSSREGYEEKRDAFNERAQKLRV